MHRLVLIFAFVVAGLCGCADDDPARIPPPDSIENPSEAIQALADAYRTRNFPAFEALLAESYTFFLNEPDPDTGETQYDRTTELRIHQRMFDPENIVTEPPPSERWLQAVLVALTPQTEFTERSDLYTDATPPGPLDPTRWIAVEARYGADVFLQLQGDADFQVTGRCSFVVLEDRAKVVGDPGKFTLYHWVDLDGAATSYRQIVLRGFESSKPRAEL